MKRETGAEAGAKNRALFGGEQKGKQRNIIVQNSSLSHLIISEAGCAWVWEALEEMTDKKPKAEEQELSAASATMEIGVTEEKGAIDGASAEAFIAEKHIGERIKRLRLKRSMGLVELGRQTGLSASFLSQLETGRVVPTLRNLARVSIVFGKDLAYFFEPEPQPMFRIHRKKERTRMPQSGVDDPTYYFESLGYMVPDRQLDPYIAEFLPLRKGSDVKAHVHPGSEFLYVLSGELEIRHADKVHVLEAGDGVYFDANTPHAYRCNGETPAQVIIVTMHQQQAQTTTNTLRPLNVARQGSAREAGTTAAGKNGVAAGAGVQAPRPNGSSASL